MHLFSNYYIRNNDILEYNVEKKMDMKIQNNNKICHNNNRAGSRIFLYYRIKLSGNRV